jgi:hypothetical protein
MGDRVQGRRRDDVPFGQLPDWPIAPGDYWRYLDPKTGKPLEARTIDERPAVAENLTGGVWGVSAPNGAGIGTLVLHTVREEDDGTASIRPNDGSSNSVLIEGANAYHGYLEHGVWESV